MTASFDLPRLSDPGRHVRAAVGPQQVRTARDLVPRTLFDAAVWRLDEDGRVEGQRRDTLGPHWHRLTGALVRDWCRELGIGADPADPYVPRVCDDPATAAEVTDEVAALVRAEPSGTPMLGTLSAERALARRLVRAFELLPDGGGLRWRLRYCDAVLGGPGPMPPPPDDAAHAPAGLRPWGRRAARLPGEPVTAGEVERAVRTGGYLTSHDPAPDYPAVVAELRRLAGIAPSAPAASPDAGPGTRWLRRNKS